ncbi:MAG: hypothetical protein ABIJ18_05160 [archaeon]
MKLSKRGASEPAANFTVGLIIGILILFVMGGVAIKFYQNQSTTKESFNKLIENIESLEEEGKMVFELPNNYYLVSFNSADVNIDECNGEEGTLELPDSCGTYPCLCYCKTDITGNLKEDACMLMGQNCHPFTEEDLSFYYPECNSGVFIKGPNSGVMNLYYKKEAETVYLSTTKDYYPENLKAKSVEFESFTNQLKSCEQEEDCLCEPDYSFLFSQYILDFEEKKISIRFGEEIFTMETEWNFAIKGSEPQKLTLSQTQEYYGVTEQEEEQEAHYIQQVYNGEEQTQIRPRLLKQGNTFYFYTPSEQYDDLSLCGTKQIELK